MFDFLFQVLLEKGYRSLCIQAGSSEVGEVMLTKAKSKLPGFQVSWFSYKPNILADINAADLVISHAGRKPFWLLDIFALLVSVRHVHL